MHPHRLALLAALLVTGLSRAASADYTLWPESPVGPAPPPAPPEQPAPPAPKLPPHFGGARSVLVLGTGGVSTTHVDSVSRTAAVGASYFFRERMSLGVEVQASTFSYRDHAIGVHGLGPRAGYAIPIGERLAIYPTVALLYSAMNLPSRAPAPPGRILLPSDAEHRGFTVSLDVPILFHVTPQLLAGAGVSVRQDLTRYELDPVYRTSGPVVGGFVTIGGWFSLGETVAPAASGVGHVPI